MSTRHVLLLALILVTLTGCGRLITATASSVKEHPFPAQGVVCYTFSTSISCVKVTP